VSAPAARGFSRLRVPRPREVEVVLFTVRPTVHAHRRVMIRLASDLVTAELQIAWRQHEAAATERELWAAQFAQAHGALTTSTGGEA
jgi:hypothetical protein